VSKKAVIMKIETRSIMNKIVMVILLIALTGCSTYKSSFSCPASKGAGCTSMDKVYTMIKSGEIEKYDKKQRKCNGRRCSKANKQDDELMKILRGQK